jgi:3'-phosphoadenosine 5'-phosphosulfate sulfotransferase (PAPS reductase)/FAD synthetase
MSVVNVVSLSGGKDSTALALLAIERCMPNLRFLFADTGHEHQATYEYVQYLDGALRARCGVGIETVRADFSRQIQKKREFIATHWQEDLEAAGLTTEQAQEKIAQTLAVLHPTGNPFLDLCLWKGRFPSTRARFCSQELKHRPLTEAVEPMFSEHRAVVSWQGVRRDESAQRANLLERDVDFGTWEPEPQGLLIYRPILDWTVEDVFAMHKRHGVEPNPLYLQGMGRVGCMPCIHAGKREMLEIQIRFPDALARVEEWERLVSAAAKRGNSTFMDGRTTARFLGTDKGDIEISTHGIRAYAEWATTARGGRQFDLITAINLQDTAPGCSSIYGLCET